MEIHALECHEEKNDAPAIQMEHGDSCDSTPFSALSLSPAQ
jgi:hypothetical protein